MIIYNSTGFVAVLRRKKLFRPGLAGHVLDGKQYFFSPSSSYMRRALSKIHLYMPPYAVFIRVKGKGTYRYLQLVENRREGKRVAQRVLCTLGRVDDLVADGVTDSLLCSLARYGREVKLLDDYQQGRLEAGVVRQLGLDLVFGRLWQGIGIDGMLDEFLRRRGFEFPVERAVYLTVLRPSSIPPAFKSGLTQHAE